MWHKYGFNRLGIKESGTHEFRMIQPNEECHLDEKVKWNEFSNKSAYALKDRNKREYNPISEPLCVFYSVAAVNCFK